MERKRKLAFLVLQESDSSDEENDVSISELVTLLLKSKKVRRRLRHRQENYVSDIVSLFHVDEFKTFFRLSRTSVQYLKELIFEVCQQANVSGIISRQGTGGTPQIPLDDRILMFLWYMSSLDRYSSIADRFGVSESTASYAIRNLLKFANNYLMDRVIVWPNAAELQEMQEMFSDLKSFPGTCGMIDGTHISIRRPHERGIDYYNRKDYYSVILQGVVAEDMCMMIGCFDSHLFLTLVRHSVEMVIYSETRHILILHGYLLHSETVEI